MASPLYQGWPPYQIPDIGILNGRIVAACQEAELMTGSKQSRSMVKLVYPELLYQLKDSGNCTRIRER